MKTLKVALLVTTAAGAVATGGVTYATVGNSSHAPSASAAKNAALAKAAKNAGNAAPAVKPPAPPAVPTCVPNLPKGKGRQEAAAKVAQQIKALAAKAPKTPVTLPATPGVPAKVLPAGTLAKLPASKLPVCKAGEQKAAAATPPNLPKPGLPAPTGVSCASVPPVIKSEEARAKELTLPNGMRVAASHAHRIVIRSRAACVYTQAFAGGAAKMITVQRIQTSPQVTLKELAQGLKMPGRFVSVRGVDTWCAPMNRGMLWYSGQGYAIRVTGTNPAAAALVPGIASQLRTQ